MDRTEKIVAKMLCEDTGIHFMDSGGNAGRHWQRNQTKAFTEAPPVTVDFSGGHIDTSINLYHWLCDRLDYDPIMQRKFKAFSNRKSQKENNYLELMENFVEDAYKTAEKTGSRFGRIHREQLPGVVNSYNENCSLSQTIQFIYWEDEDSNHVLLQIHNGADVRGGYTAPKAFTCKGDGSIFMLSDCYIICTNDAVDNKQATLPHVPFEKCNAEWFTDDGFHWYDNSKNGPDLKEFETVEQEDENNDTGWRPGVLYVRRDGVALCPYCGSTLLATVNTY